MRPSRWAVSLVDAALSRVDEKVVPRLSRGLIRVRDRTARWRVRPVTVAAVTLLVAGTAAAVTALDRPDRVRSARTSPIWVGVHEGDSVPTYLELSRAKLAALVAGSPDRVGYALVSFARYLSPDEVAAVVGAAIGVTTVNGYGRVPLPGEQTHQVTLPATRLPGELVAAMAEVADRRAEDASSFAAMAENEPAGTLREIYVSNADVARAEAYAYRQGCSCVFALVVRGSAASLAALATSADVRAVDPAPQLADPRLAVFAPLLPEHVDWVAQPVAKAVPSQTPADG